jgi:hypothetical protein
LWVSFYPGRFPRITLKSSPETFHDLLEVEGISPAPYVGRYKWIQIARSNLLPAPELESLIRQSYEMVAAKARSPKSQRVKAAKKDVRKKTTKKEKRKKEISKTPSRKIKSATLTTHPGRLTPTNALD